MKYNGIIYGDNCFTSLGKFRDAAIGQRAGPFSRVIELRSRPSHLEIVRWSF